MFFNNRNVRNAVSVMQDYEKSTLGNLVPSSSNSYSTLVSLGRFFNARQDVYSAVLQSAVDQFSAVNVNMCTEEMLQSRGYQYAVTAMLMGNLCYVFNAKYPDGVLCTLSYSLLKMWKSNSRLPKKSVDDLLKYEKSIGTRDPSASWYKKLKGCQPSEGFAYKVNVSYIGENEFFDLKSNFFIFDINTSIIIPVDVVHTGRAYISNLLSNYICEVKSGDRLGYYTYDNEVLGRLYSSARVSQLMSIATAGNMLNSMSARSLVVPRVGASVFTNGYRNLDLCDIDYIRCVAQVPESELQDINTDVGRTQVYVLSKLSAMSNGDLARLCSTASALFDEVATKRTSEGLGGLTRDELLFVTKDVVSNVYDNNLFSLVQSSSFSQLNVADIRAMSAKWGIPVPVEIPTSVSALRRLLGGNVCRLTMLSKKTGKVTGLWCTSNKDILDETYGADLNLWESLATRLAGLKEMISSDMYRTKLKTMYGSSVSVPMSELMRLLLKWNLTPEDAGLLDYYTAKTSVPIGVIVNAADTGIRESRDNAQAKSINNPDLVTVRTLGATNQYQYFRSVSLSNIVACEIIK